LLKREGKIVVEITVHKPKTKPLQVGCVFLIFFIKFWIFSVRFETVLFVSVVSIKVRNSETNRKIFFWGFTKQTETNAKQILFRFVSVRTENIFFSFRGHPR
jgi:hypothetical protein